MESKCFARQRGEVLDEMIIQVSKKSNVKKPIPPPLNEIATDTSQYIVIDNETPVALPETVVPTQVLLQAVLLKPAEDVATLARDESIIVEKKIVGAIKSIPVVFGNP